MAAYSENVQFAQTAFAQFNLSIQSEKNGNPVYVITHSDNRVIAALAQKLAADFQNITPRLTNGNTTITFSNNEIEQMRIAFGRYNRFYGDGQWTGNFNPLYQINIEELMRPPQQPAANPQVRHTMPPQAATGPLSPIYFSPEEVKNIFQQLNANPALGQQFLRSGGKNYGDTLALQNLPNKSLYMCQQLTNLRLAIDLLYQINVGVAPTGNIGYHLTASTPHDQQGLQSIKTGITNQSQNRNSFLPAPQPQGSAAAPQPQSQSPALPPQRGITRRSLGGNS